MYAPKEVDYEIPDAGGESRMPVYDKFFHLDLELTDGVVLHSLDWTSPFFGIEKPTQPTQS